jgi:hypothetical protein
MLEGVELMVFSRLSLEDLASHLMFQSSIIVVVSNDTKLSLSKSTLMILHLLLQLLKTLFYEVTLYPSRIW